MVKRLRHRPFTAVTRVRFPSGSLAYKLLSIDVDFCACTEKDTSIEQGNGNEHVAQKCGVRMYVGLRERSVAIRSLYE